VIAVIGDSHGMIPHHLGASHKLGRDKLTVTENGMGMKINHDWLLGKGVGLKKTPLRQILCQPLTDLPRQVNGKTGLRFRRP
jgi:hypothetical protein